MIQKPIDGLGDTYTKEQIDNLIANSKEIDGTVSVFSDLPAPTVDNVDEIWLVTNASGIIGINRKKSGLYISDGTKWIFLNPNERWNEDENDIFSQNSKNVNLKGKGLKDNNVTTPVNLGDINNTGLDTTNKTILGGINENKSNIEGIVLTDTDCNTVTTGGRYGMIGTPTNGAKAGEFALDVTSDGTRVMQIATYTDTSIYSRVYNGATWEAWVDGPVTSANQTALNTKQDILTEGAFVDGDKTKLDGIEPEATADQTAGEIKTAYESNANTNAFTDALKTLLETKKVKNVTTDAVNDFLVITYTDDTTANLNLNDVVTDIHVSGATLNATTNVLTLTSDDGGADVTVDLSDFVNSSELTTALAVKADQTSLTAHIDNSTNPHSVTKAQVGLANVDNTSDANKPVSTAQQTEIDTKVDKVASTDNAIVRFDGTNGEVQDSGVVIDDDGTLNVSKIGRENAPLLDLDVLNDWSKTVNVTINSSNSFTSPGASGIFTSLFPLLTKEYKIIIDIEHSSTVQFRNGSGSGSAYLIGSVSGNKRETVKFNFRPSDGDNSSFLYIRHLYSGTTTIHSISVREVVDIGSINTSSIIGNAVTQSATDTTAGRLLKVGDFGVGGDSIPIPAGTDLDTLVTSASYFTSASVTNKPPHSSNGILVVSGWGEMKIVQTFYNINSNLGDNYTRSSADGLIWTAWKKIYNQGSILGTVSQSAGVPTGSIIERGSNANGEYTKFADGTMICTRKIPASLFLGSTYDSNGTRQGITFYRSDSATITFASSFNDAAKLSVAFNINSGHGTASPMPIFINSHPPTTNSISSQLRGLGGPTTFNDNTEYDGSRLKSVDMVATGRWY